MADGVNSASDQFPRDDVGSPETGSQWRTGQPSPSHASIPSEHFSPGDEVKELDIRKYGACYDPNYKDSQYNDEKFPTNDYDQDSDD